MRQFKLTTLHVVAVIILAAATFTACKKDAFSEKDALAAQTTLLQTKFSYDLAIKTMDLQIQRTADSARIVLQNMVNSGATALEILKQTNLLAQIAQKQLNDLILVRYNDSLSRNVANLTDALTRLHEKFTDSLTKAQNNATLLAQLAKQYTVTVLDNVTLQPVPGATVSVVPVGATAIVSATSDALGAARFAATLIVDPASYFSISAPNFQSALVRENTFATGTSTQTVSVGGYTISVTARNVSVSLYNPTNTRNTIRGSVLADLDLTNGDAIEGIAGHVLTFTTTVNNVSYQFATLTDAAGNYSVKVPDANFTLVTSGTLKMQQKMFVNAWTDEDASVSIPRIDSTGTVFQLSTAGNVGSIGTGSGYYFKFPNDINGKIVFASTGNNFSNANNTTAPNMIPAPFNYVNNATTPFPFANRAVGGNRSDSILGTFNPTANNFFFNNSSTQQAFDGAVRYRSRAGTAAQPLDTVPVTFVSLVPGWMITPAQLVAVISASNNNTGRVQSMSLAKTDNSAFIQTVANGGVPVGPTNNTSGVAGVNFVANNSFGSKATAGGIFNQAVMFTQAGRSIFNNLSGIIATGFYPAGTLQNPTTVTVSGNANVYVAIEYRNVVSKDRTPR